MSSSKAKNTNVSELKVKDSGRPCQFPLACVDMLSQMKVPEIEKLGDEQTLIKLFPKAPKGLAEKFHAFLSLPELKVKEMRYLDLNSHDSRQRTVQINHEGITTVSYSPSSLKELLGIPGGNLKVALDVASSKSYFEELVKKYFKKGTQIPISTDNVCPRKSFKNDLLRVGARFVIKYLTLAGKRLDTPKWRFIVVLHRFVYEEDLDWCSFISDRISKSIEGLKTAKGSQVTAKYFRGLQYISLLYLIAIGKSHTINDIENRLANCTRPVSHAPTFGEDITCLSSLVHDHDVGHTNDKDSLSPLGQSSFKPDVPAKVEREVNAKETNVKLEANAKETNVKLEANAKQSNSLKGDNAKRGIAKEASSMTRKRLRNAFDNGDGEEDSVIAMEASIMTRKRSRNVLDNGDREEESLIDKEIMTRESSGNAFDNGDGEEESLIAEKASVMTRKRSRNAFDNEDREEESLIDKKIMTRKRLETAFDDGDREEDSLISNIVKNHYVRMRGKNPAQNENDKKEDDKEKTKEEQIPKECVSPLPEIRISEFATNISAESNPFSRSFVLPSCIPNPHPFGQSCVTSSTVPSTHGPATSSSIPHLHLKNATPLPCKELLSDKDRDCYLNTLSNICNTSLDLVQKERMLEDVYNYALEKKDSRGTRDEFAKKGCISDISDSFTHLRSIRATSLSTNMGVTKTIKSCIDDINHEANIYYSMCKIKDHELVEATSTIAAQKMEIQRLNEKVNVLQNEKSNFHEIVNFAKGVATHYREAMLYVNSFLQYDITTDLNLLEADNYNILRSQAVRFTKEMKEAQILDKADKISKSFEL